MIRNLPRQYGAVLLLRTQGLERVRSKVSNFKVRGLGTVRQRVYYASLHPLRLSSHPLP
jgi:hypothetical protein